MLRLQAVVIGGNFLFMAGSSCLLPPLSTVWLEPVQALPTLPQSP